MKTIKIIDLLTDLFSYRETNPEWLPKRIRFNGETFIFKDNVYCNEDNGENIMLYVNHTLDLRVQAEILDEEVEFEYIEEITLEGQVIGYGILSKWLGSRQTDKEKKLCSAIECLGTGLNVLIKNQKKIIERLKEE